MNTRAVEERTYVSELHLQHSGEGVTIDARPSYSIAIALRLPAPIYAAEELLGDTGDDSGAEDDDADDEDEHAPDFSASFEPGATTDEMDAELTADQLTRYLETLLP